MAPHPASVNEKRWPDAKPTARAGQLLLFEFVLIEDQALLLGLQLDLRPEHVDARAEARLALVDGQVKERLRGCHLRLRRRDPRRPRHGLQIQVHGYKNYRIAGVPKRTFGGAKILCRRAMVVNGREIQRWLADERARVEHVERTDDLRDTRKSFEAKRRQIHLLAGLRDIGAEIGQQRAQ